MPADHLLRNSNAKVLDFTSSFVLDLLFKMLWMRFLLFLLSGRHDDRIRSMQFNHVIVSTNYAWSCVTFSLTRLDWLSL